MDKYITRFFGDKKPASKARQGIQTAVAPNGKKVALSRIVFDKYDANGDGKMSLEEFKELVHDRGYAFAVEEAVAAFAKIDTDASGFIDYEEFLQFWKIEDRFEKLKLQDEDIQKVQEIFMVFQHYDTGNKGALKREEWEELSEYMKKAGYDMDLLTFDKIDVNKDGAIEFEEYLQLMISTFHLIYDEE